MTELQITSTLPLKSGHEIPILGFGTCASETCTQSAVAALRNSYIHIDTAQIYKNEAETGAAIAQSKISPSEMFVCSKLWDDMYTREGALAGVESSLLIVVCCARQIGHQLACTNTIVGAFLA